MDTNRIMRLVLRQNEDWLERKCARRRRREILSWASRSHSCLAFSRGRACGAPWFLRFLRKSLGRVS